MGHPILWLPSDVGHRPGHPVFAEPCDKAAWNEALWPKVSNGFGCIGFFGVLRLRKSRWCRDLLRSGWRDMDWVSRAMGHLTTSQQAGGDPGLPPRLIDDETVAKIGYPDL